MTYALANQVMIDLKKYIKKVIIKNIVQEIDQIKHFIIILKKKKSIVQKIVQIKTDIQMEDNS